MLKIKYTARKREKKIDKSNVYKLKVIRASISTKKEMLLEHLPQWRHPCILAGEYVLC